MLFAVENALAALKDQVGADGVLCDVQLFRPWVLFWEQDNGLVVFGHSRVSGVDGVSDVAPDVWCVVPVEINNRFRNALNLFSVAYSCPGEVGVCVFVIFNVGCDAVSCHLVEVILIGLRSDNINNFVEGSIRVGLLVSFNVVAQDAVVWNFTECYLRQAAVLVRFNHGFSSELAFYTLIFWSLKIFLGGLSQVFGECWFSHSWKSNRNEKKLFYLVHLFLGNQSDHKI